MAILACTTPLLSEPQRKPETKLQISDRIKSRGTNRIEIYLSYTKFVQLDVIIVFKMISYREI